VGAKVRRAEAGGERFLRWALSRRSGPCDLERLGSAYREKVKRCGRAIVRELDFGTGEHVDRDALARLDVPTVLLYGTESSPEFEAATRRLRSALPSARLLEVPGSGHMIAVDAPDAVVAAVP
jgi:pimeloyl-ACP methyl ester carboxylesterase